MSALLGATRVHLGTMRGTAMKAAKRRRSGPGTSTPQAPTKLKDKGGCNTKMQQFLSLIYMKQLEACAQTSDFVCV